MKEFLKDCFGDRYVENVDVENVIGTVFPTNKDEILKLIEACNRWGGKLQINSSGKNWGYGTDQAKTSEPYFNVNLSRMNRILELNEKLAYVIIEPGVTYQQLYNYLQDQTKGRLLIDGTGSSMMASVVGNLLERGHGQTPYGDHINCACNFEVVLGNQDTIQTGYGNMNANSLENLDKWGLGPSVEGLFSQSNFGIVTRATVWLLPRPENISLLQFGFNQDNLENVVDKLIEFKLKKYIHTGPHFANSYFLLSRLTRLAEHSSSSSLSKEKAKELFSKFKIPDWTTNIVLYGTDKNVSETEHFIRKYLASYSTQFTMTKDENQILDPNPIKTDFSRFMDQVAGRLGGTGISRLYWRKNTSNPNAYYDLDIKAEGIGVNSIPITCPADGSSLKKIEKLLSSLTNDFGFEPFTTAIATRDRALQVHNFIVYDEHSSEQKQRASSCALSINRKMAEEGFIPHRLGVDMDIRWYGQNQHWLNFVQSIKKYTDPNNIFISTKYLPTP